MRSQHALQQKIGAQPPVLTGCSAIFAGFDGHQNSLRRVRIESESFPNFANHLGAEAPFEQQAPFQIRRGFNIAANARGRAEYV